MPNIFPNNNNEGSTGGYTPWQLGSNLALWVRADQNVTADSSNLVSSWNDLSGYGHNFTSLGANRPTLLDGYINNHPAISFNGTNNWMVSTLFNLVVPIHYFLVIKPDTLAGTVNHYFADSYNVLNCGAIFQPASTSTFSTYFGSYGPTINYTKNNWYVLDVVQNATSRIALNGGTQNNLATATVNNPNGICLGCAGTLNASNCAKFLLAEYIAFSKELSTSERFMVSNYLCSRYGISKS